MATPKTGDGVLLDVKQLSMRFSSTHGLLGRRQRSILAVDRVDLQVRRGGSIGLVGESGCGKTTLGRCILRAYRPTGGELLYRRPDDSVVDLAGLEPGELKPFRPDIRMIFQDPYSSLNPRMTVLQIVGEPLRVNNLARGSEIEDRVAQTLRTVGLRPEYLRRYPHAFSGGERQRIGIARALITHPRLVVADEAVSALDVSVRGQILNLLMDLQQEMGLTYVFVSHDLSVVEHLCDYVAVMYVGRIVEQGLTADLFSHPRHPYTEALLSAVPVPDPGVREKKQRIVLGGDVPDPAHAPSGCVFHPRCRYVRERCDTEEPDLLELGGSRGSRCHYARELVLHGIIAGGGQADGGTS